MKLNIAIIIAIAAITYGLTLHFGDTKPPANQQGIQTVKTVPTGEHLKNTNQSVSFFQFTDIKGKTHSINDFKGKKIILNFWASWCAPCIKEFPMLLAAAKNAPEEIILIALSSDLNEEAITNFINKMGTENGMNFDAPNILIALDENQQITAGLFQTFKLPETILIDRNQIMRHKFIGANWTLEDLEGRLAGF